MVKIITKKQIIKALQKEPTLKRGWWFGPDPRKPKAKCSVCAVGCILRTMSFETWARENSYSPNQLGTIATKHVSCGSIGSWEKRELKYLSTHNYLAALSVHFESGHKRNQCIKFVERNFPDRLAVTIQASDMEKWV